MFEEVKQKIFRNSQFLSIEMDVHYGINDVLNIHILAGI